MAITEKAILLPLPKEMKDKLDRLAKKRRVSRTQLIRYLLSQALEQEQLRDKLSK